MYNTADVHFYASFALAALWPKLELSIQRDFATTVLQSDPRARRLLGEGTVAPTKVFGVVPHDLGSPSGTPLVQLNAYNFQDVSRWKDLSPKFVLQCLRDCRATADDAFLHAVWPAVRVAMREMEQFDPNYTGLIENEGFPDQTYDVWVATGPSSYSGGLYLAALAAAAVIANRVGEAKQAAEYISRLDKGRELFEAILWSERNQCYLYDTSGSAHHDSIMADQLAGQWYCVACGLPGLLKPARVQAALATIFDNNVLKFKNGEAGAVNGMRPCVAPGASGGKVDKSSMQSQEVWSGTTYGLAGCMLQEAAAAAVAAPSSDIDGTGSDAGRATSEEFRRKAFHTAKGVHNAWERYGYFFQTPEAWDEKGNYRSLAYMRPLCIWSMQWALNHPPDGATMPGSGAPGPGARP
eukprot:SAG22_NODE_1346_length_4674_cov_2.003934_6_plen_410_part_00